MRAAVLTKFRAPLELREFPHPLVNEGELLVRITAAGVCGSDVHIWLGEDPRTPLPMILGHEGVGVIEEIGGRSSKLDVYGRELAIGDLVIWDRAVVCGKCYHCTVKRLPNLCASRWVYGINVGCSDPPCLHGCYADHILLDCNTKIISLADCGDAEPTAFVTAGCSGATAANAVELANIGIGEHVLVQGAGPLGLFLVACARARGAAKVIVVEGVKPRMDLARELGADLVLDCGCTTPQDRREAVMELTKGLGVNAAFEAVGRPEPILEGLELLGRGGSYLIVGTAVPSEQIPVDVYTHVVRKQVKFQGVWTNDTRHVCEALAIIRSNPRLFTEMITHRFGLDDANLALDSMTRKEAIKAAIVP